LANVYWYGGTGNWSDYTNHWSNNSGDSPSSNHGSAPGTDDNVFFDALSFTAGSQTVTVDAAACLNMDWTGATNTPTLAIGGSVIYFYGNATLILAMAITGTTAGGGLTYRGAGANTLTTNGLSLGCVLQESTAATGSLTLQDNLTITNTSANAWLWNKGTLATGNFTVVVSGTIVFSGTDAKTFTPGTSVITGAGWNYSGSNLTLTANTSTINLSGTGAFAGGGITTYNIVNLNGTAHTITGNNTFAALVLKADTTQTITFTDGTTQTITTPTFTGSVGKIKTLAGSGLAGWTISSSISRTFDYLSVSNSTITGTIFNASNSTDGGNNFGWDFTPGVNARNISGTRNAASGRNASGTRNTSSIRKVQ